LFCIAAIRDASQVVEEINPKVNQSEGQSARGFISRHSHRPAMSFSRGLSVANRIRVASGRRHAGLPSAGAAGIELATSGFGDQRSAS
jgi:hypothetical protein